ncbi:MAG TPA: primosomal protein N' [Planctomycetota bacterium]
MATRRSPTPTLFDLGEEPERTPAPARLAPGTVFVRVALNRPLAREFTYVVGPALAERARVGARVAVPFGARREIGVIVAREAETEVPSLRLKAVHAVLDDEPVLGSELLELTRWIARRYACAWGEALAAALPAPLKREAARRRVPRARVSPGIGVEQLATLVEKHPEQHRLLRTLLELGGTAMLRELLRSLRLSESPARTLRKRGWIVLDYVEEPRDPLLSGTVERPRPATLSPAQAAALATITARLETRAHRTFLLFGVTGSGKTEVYLRAIEHALAQGRGAIVLVPEIALTPQTTGWFRARFGSVAVLHSRMSDAQRFAEWKRLQSGAVRVVVGARSALFAPVADLGVIVVDEEHEPSFKQESVPRYHAREAAVERARLAGAVCLLGSATPALESWHAAATGAYELLALPERVGGGAPCIVQLVDMRRDGERVRSSQLFSRLLLHFLEETLAAGEQAILFLNRRGFVPVLYCPGCASTLRCEDCTTALAYHRRIARLVCHSCCRERAVPRACPTCSRPNLRQVGGGSERVEAELARLLPRARAARMDSDTMRRREDYETTLERFGRGELDVLVGTQMIAKGLDFPRVTLVGILAAEQSLTQPDFRAEERTFQLLAQVAGRAGRSALPGRVVVQTTEPENVAIRHGVRGDYVGLAGVLLAQRRALRQPPFGRLCRVVFEDADAARGLEVATRWVAELRRRFAGTPLTVDGPSAAPRALLRGKHRQHLQLKAPHAAPAFEQALEWLTEQAAREGRTDVKIDVDPMAML